MKQLTPLQNWVFCIGGVLVLVGAALFLFFPVYASVVFSIGVLMFVPMQMLARYEGTDFVLLRLRRQQLLGGVAMLCSAAAMVMQAFAFGPLWARGNEWLLCLTVACVLQLYTSFRIAHELEKNR